MLIKTRRDFLKAGLKSISALGAASALAKFGEMNALAAGGGYQALVCIFMSGGNDGHNTVIPLATAQQNYSQYSSTRLGMALPQNTLLPISVGSDTYGLHPSLPEIQALYNQNRCAIVSNVGMLIAPTTRAQYLASQVPVPANLFSHSDQTTQWQNVTQSGISSTGWGGRLVDQLQLQGENSGAKFPAITTTGGCGLFCTGANNLPTTVPSSGPVTLSGLSNDAARNSGDQLMLSFDNGVKLVQAANSAVNLGNGYATLLQSLISGVSIPNVTWPANNNLASQLQMVAQIIAVHSQLGLTRQIFFCQLDLFDTHSDQLATQAALLQQVSQAVAAFYQATVSLGVDQNVVTFTCSEFGRTLMPNSSSGTDHAWGGHHFVIGGPVLGGQMYGQYPLLAFNTGTDATGRGAMIPTLAVDQYGATLAKWFGVDITNAPVIGGIFPNLANFSTKSIGFLG